MLNGVVVLSADTSDEVQKNQSKSKNLQQGSGVRSRAKMADGTRVCRDCPGRQNAGAISIFENRDGPGAHRNEINSQFRGGDENEQGEVDCVVSSVESTRDQAAVHLQPE